jgi:hypothetical protein
MESHVTRQEHMESHAHTHARTHMRARLQIHTHACTRRRIVCAPPVRPQPPRSAPSPAVCMHTHTHIRVCVCVCVSASVSLPVSLSFCLCRQPSAYMIRNGGALSGDKVMTGWVLEAATFVKGLFFHNFFHFSLLFFTCGRWISYEGRSGCSLWPCASKVRAHFDHILDDALSPLLTLMTHRCVCMLWYPNILYHSYRSTVYISMLYHYYATCLCDITLYTLHFTLYTSMALMRTHAHMHTHIRACTRTHSYTDLTHRVYRERYVHAYCVGLRCAHKGVGTHIT